MGRFRIKAVFGTKFISIAAFLTVISIIAFAVSYRSNFRKRALETLSKMDSDTGFTLSEMENIAGKMLPKSKEPINGKNPNISPFIQGDMDGDGVNEIAAVYKNKKSSKNGVNIFKYADGKWKTVFELEGLGDFDLAGFYDLTGEGCSELLIGTVFSENGNDGKNKGGTSTGGDEVSRRLDILGWNGDAVVSVAQVDYHNIYVEDMPGGYGKDGIYELAIGHGDGSFEICRLWSFGQLIPAEEEAWAHFFAKELSRLEKSSDGEKKVEDLYLLAEARYYAGKYGECIRTITEALEIAKEDRELQNRFLVLKAKAHMKEGEFAETEDILRELISSQREAGIKNEFLADCLLTLGRCLGEAERFEEALEAFKNCFDLYEQLYESDYFKKLARQAIVRDAAGKLKTERAAKILEDSINGKGNLSAENIANEIKAWGNANGLATNVILPEKSDADVTVMLVEMQTAILDNSSVGTVKGFAILEYGNGKAAIEPVYAGINENYAGRVLGFRIAKAPGDALEAAILLDDESISGIKCPVFRLFRKEEGKWTKIWASPKNSWRNSDGSITFIGEGISEFVIKSSSFCYMDSRTGIFLESNTGPRRWFLDTWIRQGDEYVIKTADTVPSAYNTLVEFIYSISVGDNKTAAGCVAEKELVSKATRLGLAQKPPGQEWGIENDGNDMTGPLTVVVKSEKTPLQRRIEFSFVNRDGRYLISAIIPLSQ